MGTSVINTWGGLQLRMRGIKNLKVTSDQLRGLCRGPLPRQPPTPTGRTADRVSHAEPGEGKRGLLHRFCFASCRRGYLGIRAFLPKLEHVFVLVVVNNFPQIIFEKIHIPLEGKVAGAPGWLRQLSV